MSEEPVSCRAREPGASRTRPGEVVAEHCITCGDEGLPVTVLAVDEERVLALCCDDEGGRSSVEIALVAPVVPGDRLLVHAGTAIAPLEPAGAALEPAGAALEPAGAAR
jgi:hydrogenase maturation factor